MENFQCGSSYCLRLRAVPVPYTYLIEQEAQKEIKALLEGLPEIFGIYVNLACRANTQSYSHSAHVFAILDKFMRT
jgi:hypothetical protein